MQANVGGFDRALRTFGLAGTIATAFSPRLARKWRRVAGVLAVVEAFTVISRYCPINQWLGINTARPSRKRDQRDEDRGEYLEERRPEHYAG